MQLFVDQENGDDGTGTRGSFDLPYATILGAKADKRWGDITIVRPGLYDDVGFTGVGTPGGGGGLNAKFVRTSNVVTCTNFTNGADPDNDPPDKEHGYSVGDLFTLNQVSVLDASIVYTVASVPTAYSFTFASTGANTTDYGGHQGFEYFHFENGAIVDVTTDASTAIFSLYNCVVTGFGQFINRGGVGVNVGDGSSLIARSVRGNYDAVRCGGVEAFPGEVHLFEDAYSETEYAVNCYGHCSVIARRILSGEVGVKNSRVGDEDIYIQAQEISGGLSASPVFGYGVSFTNSGTSSGQSSSIAR